MTVGGGESRNGKKLVVVCGGLNWDMISVGDRLPKPGETYNANSFSQMAGGKGANTAIAIHRMSHRRSATQRQSDEPSGAGDDDDPENKIEVRMVGSVGNDRFGKDMKRSLYRHGVNIDGVRTQPRAQSAVAVTWIESDTGENRIFVCPGANHLLKEEEFVNFGGFKCGSAHPDMVVSQLELHEDTVFRLLKTAIDANIDTLLNPSPASFLDYDIYKGMTHLIMNESEAMVMSGQHPKPSDLSEERAIYTREELEAITDLFLAYQVKNVVITLGKEGAFCSNSPGKGRFVETMPIKTPEDTSGAGDTFVGAYTVRWIRSKQPGEQWDLTDAVRYACRAAAFVIQEVGCQNAIPWTDQLQSSAEPVRTDVVEIEG